MAAALARLAWAFWVASAAGFVLTLGAACVFVAHVLFRIPAVFDRLTWLDGPSWLVAAGLGLQAFVMAELVKVFGRWHVRLVRLSGR